MVNPILNHFSKNVDDYDTVADKVVMKNNELHDCLISSIPFGLDKKFKVLDLGCGTGHGMSLILKKFKNAKVTGVDFSKRMILKSKENIKEFLERINLIEEDFNKMRFNENYDVVISAIAIHNSNHNQKRDLFKKIFNCLNDGGFFINGDFVEGESIDIDKKYKQVYKNFLETNLEGVELDVWLRHAFKEDMPMALSQQIGALKKEGFKDIKKLWQFNNEVIYISKK
jgi:tRNA (cmo5U34)-methyltransferase